MRRKNGFTLIELLAIIVILAVIAVITVPIILDIIDNSKKGAATDSAYGYKDAVNKFYVSESIKNPEQELFSGYIDVSELPSNFTVNGELPTSDSWVQLDKGQVVSYSLKFGDYVVTKYKDDDVICQKGNVQEKENSRSIVVGDEICYGSTDSQECFKVINIFTENGNQKAMLLANYNLKKYIDNTTSPATIMYRQDVSSPDTVQFSDSDYWLDSTTTPETLRSVYSNDGTYSYDSSSEMFFNTNQNRVYPYVYDLNSNVYEYVEGYLITLKTNLYGLSSSATGRLLTNEEVYNNEIFTNISARANGKDYYIGSVSENEIVEFVGFDGGVNGSCFDCDPRGVRPVIIVPMSEL